jgi:tetratricopeptide (TPR) repeat protein
MKLIWFFLLACLPFQGGAYGQAVNFKDSTQKFFALESYQKGLTFSKQWVRSLSQGKKSKSPEMGEALTWLGFFKTETRQAKGADSAFVAAFSIFNSKQGNDSLIARATLFHANLKIYTEPDKAANLTLDAISKLEKVFGPVHPLVALGYKQLGAIYRGLETGIANMQPAFQKAISIQSQLSGVASDEVVKMKNDLGNYLAQAGYLEEGLLYIDSCLRYWSAKGSNPEKLAQLMVDKANVVDGMGRYKEADSLYNRAIDIEKKMVPVSKIRLANTYYSFAQFQKAHGELTKAEFYFLKCVEFTKALPKEEQKLVWPLQFLAVLYKDLNDFKKAEEYALACIVEIEQTVGTSPHLRVPYMVLSDVYGVLYKDKKRQEEYVWKQYEVYKKFLGYTKRIPFF